jgi:flagellar protein FlgJ
MSILPQTDIVTEVARAADPQKLHNAITRLSELSETRVRPNDDQFSGLVRGMDNGARTNIGVASAQRSMAVIPGFDRAAGSLRPASSIESPRADDATRKFEAFIIQSWIQTILPSQDHGFFGQGAAGGIWRSMLAEQIGNQIARSGGIGLKEMLERHWVQQASQAESTASSRQQGT